MAEFTNSNIVTVAAGQNVPLTETAVAGNCSIVHREGAGIVTLRGLTNQCRARYRVAFGSEYSHTYRRHRGGDHGRFSDKRRTAYQCDGNGNTGCG